MRNTSGARQQPTGPIPATGPASDPALVEAFLGGDDEAFRTLFFRYRDALVALAHNLTADFRQGEELVRRAMVRVFSKPRALQGRVPLRLLLIRGVVLECRRFDRRNALVKPFGLRWRVRTRRILPVHLATSDAVADSRRAATVGALAGLARNLREVVTLCDLDGLTYEESALVLRLRSRTVGIRLGRGRLRFAAAYRRARR